MNIKKIKILSLKIIKTKVIMTLFWMPLLNPAKATIPRDGIDLQPITSLSNSFEKSNMKPFCFTEIELSDLANYKLDCDLLKKNLYTTKRELNDCYKESSFNPGISFWGVTVAFGLGAALGVILVIDQ